MSSEIGEARGEGASAMPEHGKAQRLPQTMCNGSIMESRSCAALAKKHNAIDMAKASTDV
eukprot:3385332-Amphidinium_carterae.1